MAGEVKKNGSLLLFLPGNPVLHHERKASDSLSVYEIYDMYIYDFKVYLKFIINFLGIAFKVMKNGIYFI